MVQSEAKYPVSKDLSPVGPSHLPFSFPTESKLPLFPMASSFAIDTTTRYFHSLPDTPRVSAPTLHRRYFAPNCFPLPTTYTSNSSSLNSLSLKKAAAGIGRYRPICCAAARSEMATEEDKVVTDERMLVMVPPHPLIKHWISVLRNEETPCAMFKSALAELGRLLIYEASRDWLPTVSGEIQTPMGVANIEFVDPREPVLVIPILRAGLALAELTPSVLPATKTFHLGMRRDETTLLPTTYMNKLFMHICAVLCLPDKFPEGARLLVVDPMLATGGTMVAAIDLLKDRGAANKQIKVISAVAAPPALEKLSKKFPGLRVYTGMIDPIVNEKGFIVPGLGDAGDRSFGT